MTPALPLSLILSLILAALAGLHLLWALGFWWPLSDETRLARAVAGFPGQDRMPPAAASALVALCLTLAALWPWATLRLPGPLWHAGLAALAALFLLRGLAAYLPAWRRLTPVHPFARNDRCYYGPLCLTIGAGFTCLLTGVVS